uniref:Uncharacterized protein n=1 Tax=Oryza sativa subsp. japonica TaxID=39947 RepID=Q6EPJ6_ORYSJ|nr:hypothetical protein [Oryza sativa Japonica Group]
MAAARLPPLFFLGLGWRYGSIFDLANVAMVAAPMVVAAGPVCAGRSADGGCGKCPLVVCRRDGGEGAGGAEAADSGGGTPVTEASPPPLTLPLAASMALVVDGCGLATTVCDDGNEDKDDGNGGSWRQRPRDSNCHVASVSRSACGYELREFNGVRKTVVARQGGFMVQYGRSKCGIDVRGFGRQQRRAGDVPIDNEAPIVTLLISRYADPIFRSAHRGVPVNNEIPMVTSLISRYTDPVFRRCS